MKAKLMLSLSVDRNTKTTSRGDYKDICWKVPMFCSVEYRRGGIILNNNTNQVVTFDGYRHDLEVSDA